MSVEEFNEFIDYYQFLGVETSSSLAEIRKSFILLAKSMHPDTGGSNEEMQTLNTAYRTLADDFSRRAYDVIHSFNTGTDSTMYSWHSDPGSGVDGAEFDDEFVDYYLDSVWAEFSSTSKPFGLVARFKNLLRRKI